MQISIVTLGVMDIKKASAFYQSWFKTNPAKASNEEITFFNLPGVKLALFPHAELAKDATVDPAGQGFRGVSLAINADTREEVDAIFAAGVACGAHALKTPQKVFWGGYSGYLRDLDGNLWEIAWNPFFPKKENGELEIA